MDDIAHFGMKSQKESCCLLNINVKFECWKFWCGSEWKREYLDDAIYYRYLVYFPEASPESSPSPFHELAFSYAYHPCESVITTYPNFIVIDKVRVLLDLDFKKMDWDYIYLDHVYYGENEKQFYKWRKYDNSIFLLGIDVMINHGIDVINYERLIDQFFEKKEQVFAHKGGNWIKGADDE